MINTMLWIGLIGGIFALLKQDWRPWRIMGAAVLTFLGLSLMIYIGSSSVCPLMEGLLGSEIRFFVCDPPEPGWRW